VWSEGKSKKVKGKREVADRQPRLSLSAFLTAALDV
jgi:hypothetical protein